jgi:hypothetical protein
LPLPLLSAFRSKIVANTKNSDKADEKGNERNGLWRRKKNGIEISNEPNKRLATAAREARTRITSIMDRPLALYVMMCRPTVTCMTKRSMPNRSIDDDFRRGFVLIF